MTTTIELPLASIEVGTDRARDLDTAWAEGLARIIEQQGLFHPITVRPEGAGHRLVSGMHRLEAFRILGRETISATLSEAANDDEARLEEVMENLGRNELVALDRCHHLYDLKQVWERLYPETKAGVAGGKARQGSANEMFSFAAATAEAIGLSQRSIQIAVKIWSGLVPTVKRQLAGTDLATKQTELKALSELDARKQMRVMDLILGEENPGIKNVAGALAYLADGVVATAFERQFETAKKVIAGMDDRLLDQVLAVHIDRVVASLKRQGAI